jgi:hypothetical protein
MAIPIDFLIDKLDIKIKISKTDYYTIISIRSMKKNLMVNYQICNQHLQHQKMMSSFCNDKTQMNMISNHIVNTIQNMFPHFKKMDIDYSSLEKNYIYP